MEILGSIILFIIFIFSYLVIVEIFVVLFKFTGLNDEKSRFQVISMLTNSGYTTQEAELILSNRVRRKLARFVMLFGYAFTVTIVSTIVNIFFQFRNTYIGGAVAFIPVLIIISLVIFFIRKSKFTNNLINKLIDKIVMKFFSNSKNNNILIIEKFYDLAIAEIKINIMPEELKDTDLEKSNVRVKYGINILFKKENINEIIPTPKTKFNVGDIIIVMGAEENIKKLFKLRENKIANK